MERERERLATIEQESSESVSNGNEDHEAHSHSVKINAPPDANERKGEHLFKQLLVACCDSCERRASLVTATSTDELDSDEESGEESENREDEDVNTFECLEENKAEIHDVSLHFKKYLTLSLRKNNFDEKFVWNFKIKLYKFPNFEYLKYF